MTKAYRNRQHAQENVDAMVAYVLVILVTMLLAVVASQQI